MISILFLIDILTENDLLLRMVGSKSKNKLNQYCTYCDHTGIIQNMPSDSLGQVPLSPCPKCVLSDCQCQGEEPYFILKNNKVEDCSCRAIRLKIDRINRIYNNSGIDKLFRWKFFNDFRVKDNKSASLAKNAAYDISVNFPNVAKGLYLWGSPGTGKTLLSSILLTELIIRQAVPGKFMKISRSFFSRLKDSFNEKSLTYGKGQAIEREFAEIDILVIDDFGVQRDSAWEQETLYNLIDARYEAKRFTLFTSNNDPFHSLKDLSHGRILSRLKEMCRFIKLEGPDQREFV